MALDADWRWEHPTRFQPNGRRAQLREVDTPIPPGLLAYCQAILDRIIGEPVTADDLTPAEIKANERRPTQQQVNELDAEYKRRWAETGGAEELGDWYAVQMRQLYGFDAHFREAGREHKVKGHITPESRRRRHLGLECRAKGHDLTVPLPSGKASVYLAPNGTKACQWCRKDSKERSRTANA